MKEEPIELDDIPLPDFLAHDFRQRTADLKVMEVPSCINPKPAFVYQSEIVDGKSCLNLKMDECEKIKCLPDSKKFPERMQFFYTGGSKIVTWPLRMILKEDYKTLVKIYSKITRKGAAVGMAREILSRITSIRESWANEDVLPRKLTIPYTGQKIHLEPFWMMEFRDETGQRRFFRMEDQLKKADNDTLRFLQSKLDPTIEEEAFFIRALQKQININNGDDGTQREPKRKRRRLFKPLAQS